MNMKNNDTEEVYHCEKCGKEEPPKEMLIPVEIPLTGEEWDLCESCVEDMVDWIKGNDE